ALSQRHMSISMNYYALPVRARSVIRKFVSKPGLTDTMEAREVLSRNRQPPLMFSSRIVRIGPRRNQYRMNMAPIVRARRPCDNGVQQSSRTFDTLSIKIENENDNVGKIDRTHGGDVRQAGSAID